MTVPFREGGESLQVSGGREGRKHTFLVHMHHGLCQHVMDPRDEGNFRLLSFRGSPQGAILSGSGSSLAEVRGRVRVMVDVWHDL